MDLLLGLILSPGVLTRLSDTVPYMEGSQVFFDRLTTPLLQINFEPLQCEMPPAPLSQGDLPFAKAEPATSAINKAIYSRAIFPLATQSPLAIFSFYIFSYSHDGFTAIIYE